MWKNQSVCSIIPARGGSKGIPKKNIYPVNGLPLIAYTIQASLGCEYVDETWVSSDDDEIINVAKFFGAKTIKRPQAIATDTSSSEEALLHFAKSHIFDVLVFMQATSPLTIASDIQGAIEMLETYDSVITVSEFTQLLWTEGAPQYNINSRKRRQDTQQTYVETGAIFITSRDRLISSKNRVSGNIGLYKVPKVRSFDIDSYDDLYVIERIMKSNE